MVQNVNLKLDIEIGIKRYSHIVFLQFIIKIVMPESKYKITLYSKRWNEEILTYDFPDILPSIGDLIEIIEEDVFFAVNSRVFKSGHSSNDPLIPVMLYGEIDGHKETTDKSKFDAILKKLDYKLGEINNRKLYIFERPKQ